MAIFKIQLRRTDNGELIQQPRYVTEDELNHVRNNISVNTKTGPVHTIEIFESYADDDETGNELRFRYLCETHDVWYAYSDDHRVWSSGENHLRKLKEQSTKILPDTAAEIWNDTIGKILETTTDAQDWVDIRFELAKDTL